MQSTGSGSDSGWATRLSEKQRRLKLVDRWLDNHILATEHIVGALESLIQTNDRVVIEGDNQKQAMT
jgi:malonate decarboxylase alpha subunit